MTTPRPRAWTRRAALLSAASAGLVGIAGCDPRSLFYFLQPWEPTIAPPKETSLKGKKVVVYTTAAPSATGEAATVSQEVTRELVAILRNTVKKIEVVDPDKVNAWANDHQTWSDPGEIAKAFDADAIVYLEIEEFSYQDPHSPGLLEGHSRTHVQLYRIEHPKNSSGKEQTDQEKESRRAYDEYRDCTFPTRGPV